ncbi:MAG: general secretion pathway protein GspL [Lysobacteraceae bacterium]|nr:MAG: general secretion pathway protein GspL [Xanthomonadaceae bacterium]
MSASLSPLARFESAGRGLRGLLAWWGAGLSAWLPTSWRQALAASSDRLLLQVQGDDLQLRRQGGGGLQDVANLPVPPARGEGIDPLAEVLTAHAGELPRWLLLPAASGLRRSLLLPATARERLREVLGFEIERQTPFAAGEVVYDGRVLGVRDDGQLQAELVVVPRARADAATARLGALSGWLAGIDLADADGRPLGVNLLPPAQRHHYANPWRLWNIALFAATLLALAFGLSQVLDNRRAAAAQLQADVAKRSAQARSVSQQRQRLVDAVEGGAYLNAQRNARPSAIEVMDELARRLPDGTYLEKVSIEGGQLMLIGLSNEAAALVGKLEGAKQWRAPALSGALQQDPRTRSDRFNLVAQLNDASANGQVAAKEAARATR